MTRIIISALALAACSRANDASALANDIKALETESASLEAKLHFWTALVAIGLVMEFLVIFHDFREEKIAFRRGTIRSPERPSKAKFSIELLATLLITVGVIGEFKVGVESSSISALLRSKSHELEGMMAKESDELRKQAADTRERAAKLEQESLRIRFFFANQNTWRVKLLQRNGLVGLSKFKGQSVSIATNPREADTRELCEQTFRSLEESGILRGHEMSSGLLSSGIRIVWGKEREENSTRARSSL